MRSIAILAIAGLLSACATSPSSTTTQPAAASTKPAPASNVRTVKSMDGSFEGEIVGNINPKSKFAKLKIGMSMSQVQGLIKAPDDMIQHETGKRWIPFYYGNDVRRIQAYYAGEGCLTYTGGNQFGAGGNELIRITVDSTRGCMDS